MRRPGFAEGVLVAFAGALLTGAAWSLLAVLLPTPDVARLVVTAAAGGYLLYLLRRGRLRVGRPSAALAWLALVGVLVLLDPPLVAWALAHAAAVWLVRVLAFQPGALAALADLALLALGLLAAAWAMVQTQSPTLAAWCLLLVQAPFARLPAAVRRDATREHPADPGEERFRRAERAADAALERLAARG